MSFDNASKENVNALRDGLQRTPFPCSASRVRARFKASELVKAALS